MNEVRNITTLDTTEIDRLFNTCKDKILEGTMRLVSGDKETEAHDWLTSDLLSLLGQPDAAVFGYYKNNVLCWVRYGSIEDGILRQSYYLAGADSEGSREYLYSQEFFNALNSYYRANYSGLLSWSIKDSSTSTYESNVVQPMLYDLAATYETEEVRDLDDTHTLIQHSISF